MIGHELRMSQTNTYGWVPVCQCGWIGAVEVIADHQPGETARTLRRQDLAKDGCRGQHVEHCHAEAEAISAASERALDAHAALVGKSNDLFLRRGRWGRA